MMLTSRTLAGLVAVIMFGGIFLSSATGAWQTESTKEAAKYTSGEFAGQTNPADIRGSYTFADIDKNFQVSPTVLAEAFGVKVDDPAAFQAKGLEEMYSGSEKEVGTASIRLFVALFRTLPFDLSADIYLPESAVALLRARNLTVEQSAYLSAHTVPNLISGTLTSSAPAASATVTAPATPTKAASTDRTVKGNTTFADLTAWGVSKEAIEKVLGMPMPAALTKVKDFCTEKGLNFETVKTDMQALVDKAK